RRGDDQALVRTLVGEHRLAGAVADRPEPRRGRAPLRVDDDEPAVVEPDAALLESDPLAIGPPPDGRQDHVALERLDLVADLDRDREAVVALLVGLRLRAEVH